ncbi:MAG: hypothetical protein JWM28_3746, partial [Chitinophagaceae bacterium]|nr:hypothetical protein [Chitinophagaceae bacterium]
MIFIDEADKPYSVFGTYQIFPAGTIGIPAKQYDSGQITYNVKDINNQKIITSFLSAN